MSGRSKEVSGLVMYLCLKLGHFLPGTKEEEGKQGSGKVNMRRVGGDNMVRLSRNYSSL